MKTTSPRQYWDDYASRFKNSQPLTDYVQSFHSRESMSKEHMGEENVKALSLFIGFFRKTEARFAVGQLDSKAAPPPPFVLTFSTGIYHLR